MLSKGQSPHMLLINVWGLARQPCVWGSLSKALHQAPSDTDLLDAQRQLDPEDHLFSALLLASSTVAFPSLH